MKVLYDHQIFTRQKYGGISRYFTEIIKELKVFENINVQTSVLLSNNHYIANKNLVKYLNFFPQKEFKGKYRLMNFLNKIKSILSLKKMNYDIFHPTYYHPYFLKYIRNRPFVLTVYDMIHEKFPNMFTVRNKTMSIPPKTRQGNKVDFDLP